MDTFRKQHPNVVGYTYWGYRHGGRKTNKGISPPGFQKFRTINPFQKRALPFFLFFLNVFRFLKNDSPLEDVEGKSNYTNV